VTDYLRELGVGNSELREPARHNGMANSHNPLLNMLVISPGLGTSPVLLTVHVACCLVGQEGL